MSKPEELKDYEEVAQHQKQHCEQISLLVEAYESLALSVSILSTALQAKGVVSRDDLLRVIEKHERNEETTKETYN